MKSRKYSKLKRNPLVRLIRRVLRFLNGLFNPKKATFTSSYRQYSSNEYNRGRSSSITELSNSGEDELITVGELFEEVKWQLDQPNTQEEILGISRIHRTHDVSRN